MTKAKIEKGVAFSIYVYLDIQKRKTKKTPKQQF